MKKLPAMRLLICDTAENAAEALLSALAKYKIAATAARANGKTELFAALRTQDWDLLLLNEKVAEIEARECAACIREHKSNIALVVLTGAHIGVEELCQCYRQGAAALVSLDSLEYSVTVIGREFVNVQNRRRQLELARENAELAERCQLLLRSSREAIAYVHDGMHVYANDSYRALYGFADMDELMSTPFIDTVEEDCKESLKSRLKGIREPAGSGPAGAQGLDVAARRGDGTAFKARLVISPTVFEGEKCLQVIAAAQEQGAGETAAAPERPAQVPQVQPAAAEEEKTPAAPAIEARANGATASVIPLETDRKAAPEALPMKEMAGRLIAERSGEILYQPVIAVADMEAELYALELRLREDGGRLHLSEDYLEAVNRNPLGRKLDQWALESALNTLSRFDKQGERLQFLVGVTAQSLADRKLPESLSDLLALHGLDSQALVLNLRQGDVVENLEHARAMIDKLQGEGGRVCLSDFSASVKMLDFVREARVRLVRLKKDVSRKILEDKHYGQELAALVANLHDCGAKVIAAQVDDTATLSALWQADVDLVQGSLLPNLDTEAGPGAGTEFTAGQSARPLTRQAGS